jgi:hypothetical protein
MRGIVLSSATTAVLLTALLVGIMEVTTAQVRSSNNYQLQSDSINIGGGFSTSTNFEQESTVGEVATGFSTSSNYQLRAGYQQMQEVFISVSAVPDVVMSPGLPGITGGVANGSTTVTVVTDSPSGYALTLESETSPTLQDGGNTIADLNTTDPRVFDFTAAGAQNAAFAFSPSGVDILDTFRSSGSTCGSGTDETERCWEGPSTTAATIAQGTGGNQPAGATTTIFYRVVIDNNAGVPAGVYTGTSTVTALPL